MPIQENNEEVLKVLIDVYQSQCQISQCDVPSSLEAVFITNLSKAAGLPASKYALLLRKDLHVLFEEKEFSINPKNYTVVLGPKLTNSVYKEFEGIKICLPQDKSLYPDQAELDLHFKQSSQNWRKF